MQEANVTIVHCLDVCIISWKHALVQEPQQRKQSSGCEENSCSFREVGFYENCYLSIEQKAH